MRHLLRLALLLLLALALDACRSGDCADVTCGACPQSLTLTVTLAGGGAGPVTVTGAGTTTCAPSGAVWACGAAGLGPGEYTATVSAPGHASVMETFTITAASAGCCACTGTHTASLTLEVAPDVDASLPDAGGSDSGPEADAGPGTDSGAESCNPSAVAFPMGGDLSPGTLCDDVFACVADATEAAAVTAASSSFTCSPTPSGPCSAYTCMYAGPGGPSTLDAAEIAEICAVTLVTPTPAMTCRVYL
jgi:hypothetical protein